MVENGKVGLGRRKIGMVFITNSSKNMIVNIRVGDHEVSIKYLVIIIDQW